METIVLASNNKHKIKEFREILKDYNIITLKDIEYFEEIEETGNSFEENALIKARTIHNYLMKKKLDYIVVADDSGLCVNALNGRPGIYSARYAGEPCDNQANRDKLQEELKGKEDRSAYFICSIVVYYPDGEYKIFEGKTFGSITKEEIGEKSFGYDCIFYSEDIKKTFGEASGKEKNEISHRARAIKAMKNTGLNS